MEVDTSSSTTFTATSDICQQLLDRYGNSSAPQHRHLIATAAASRSILTSESLSLTPLSYFAAAISAATSSSLDSDASSSLASFLSVVLPLVPEGAVAPGKAAEAVAVIAELAAAVSTAGVRAVVKCLGVLLGFCDSEDWSSVQFGVRKLLEFSIDRRPKVRRCALDCFVSIIKSVESSTFRKEASKLILSMLKEYIPLASEMSDLKATKVSEDVKFAKPEHLDVIHVLTLLKHVVPFLSMKVISKILQQLQKLVNTHFTPLTRHIFGVIEAIIETLKDGIVISEGEIIMKSLAAYISVGVENPKDTLLSAATLLKSMLAKMQISGESKWMTYLPSVLGSVVDLLDYEATTSERASDIVKEFLSSHINSTLLTIVGESVADEDKSSMESRAVKSTCAVFEDMLNNCTEIANKHKLAVISFLFRHLGELSFFYMKGSILKLAEMMNLAIENKYEIDHLQECFGSAVCAVGPEKVLTLVPINLSVEDLTCSNVWLIPILRKYVSGSSLGFFMEYFVPLAESSQKLSAKALKSGLQTDLRNYAHDFWGLLPAFFHYPTDTCENFGSVAELLITLLPRKDSFMLENIAIALQQIVNQNKSALSPRNDASELDESSIELKNKASYTKKIARRNIRALASCSEKLLRPLIDVFFDSSPKERVYLKDAIGCLASITDSSVTKNIFISSLEQFGLLDGGQGNSGFTKSNGKISPAMELASSIVEGASEDLIDLILKLIKDTLKEEDEVIQSKAYDTLCRTLEEQRSFCSSRVDELADLLLGLKSPVSIVTLRSRLGCFQLLLTYSMSSSLEEENPKTFLVLNEIILTIKDSYDEARKAAYDMLIGLTSKLQQSSSVMNPEEAFPKLISMILGYLSGSSPQIKSGAVSALSILVYNNAEICAMMPELVPAVLALLQTKAMEVIKAVLGFVKVLVSSQQVSDLEDMLPEIISAVLPWSPVSRLHFREKVAVIFEIMIRKCGVASVESLVPDKHSTFFKSVQENRHGKRNLKESSAKDPESIVPGSFSRGNPNKRKHNEESSFPRDEETMMKKPRLRNWDKKKDKGFIPRNKEMRNNGAEVVSFGRDRKFKAQSRGSDRNKGNDYKNKMNQRKPAAKHVGRKKVRKS